jgi:putative endonuclease
MKSGRVYLMASRFRGETYLGATSNLPQRAWQHRNRVSAGHARDKDCILLVWYEYFDDLQDARACEYRMKKWKRAWKLRLIEERNPEWRDLFDQVCA